MQLRSMSVDVLSNVATFLHIGFKFTAKNGMKNRREEEEDEKPKLRVYRTKICVQCRIYEFDDIFIFASASFSLCIIVTAFTLHIHTVYVSTFWRLFFIIIIWFFSLSLFFVFSNSSFVCNCFDYFYLSTPSAPLLLPLLFDLSLKNIIHVFISIL